jgi:hypothetical protein
MQVLTDNITYIPINIFTMKKVFPVLLVFFIALACCVGSGDSSGEKIIGESIRKDTLMNEEWKYLRNEVIIEPGETVKAPLNITEPSEGMMFFRGQAKLVFVLKFPNGNINEWTQPHTGGWNGDHGLDVKDTGLFEVSVTNLEKKPAYLWYSIYVVPEGMPDEVLEEYDNGIGPEDIYLILS